MNSGRTIDVQNGNRRSPADVVIRGARQTLGGAVTVVGSVGTVAGRLIDGAGTVLDTTAGALSGTLLLVGDVLNTTGHVLGSTVSGLGGTITLAGNLVSGSPIADAAVAGSDRAAETVPASPAGKPSVSTPKKTRPGGATRPSGTPA
ncbi:MAG TPA: hypothetical protein VEG38_19870 [Acidimicrobiia bacterium]|nr:hypothetical protein [Acidimicrobiia bacterium]